MLKKIPVQVIALNMETEERGEGALLLDLVVGHGAVVLHLLMGEDQTLGFDGG